MQKTTKAIIILIISYIAYVAYAFGVFLQQPITEGQSLTVQAVLEPFVYIFLMVLGHYFLIKTIYSQQKNEKNQTEEGKLLVPTIILLAILVFGAGMHTVGQLIEETFINTSNAGQYVGNFSYQVTYFLEEYPAHLLVIIPYFILLYFLTLTESNRKAQTTQPYEKIILIFCALLFGLLFGILNAESNAGLLAILLNTYLILKYSLSQKKLARNFWSKPFSAFWIIGVIVMIITGIGLGMTNGWFIQPTDLGFGTIGGSL